MALQCEVDLHIIKLQQIEYLQEVYTMKYFILNGTFKEGRPEGPAFKAALDAHHAYTAEYIKMVIFLPVVQNSAAGVL